MPYKPRGTPGGVAASDIKGATNIRGIGTLNNGTYHGIVADIHGDVVEFHCLPDGSHIEAVKDATSFLKKGDKVKLVVGVTPGAGLQRNKAGQYAFVNVANKSEILTAWDADLMAVVAAGEKLVLACPAIKSISISDKIVLEREDILV